MAGPSTIKRLPPDIRERLDEWVRDEAVTQREATERVNELLVIETLRTLSFDLSQKMATGEVTAGHGRAGQQACADGAETREVGYRIGAPGATDPRGGEPAVGRGDHQEGGRRGSARRIRLGRAAAPNRARRLRRPGARGGARAQQEYQSRDRRRDQEQDSWDPRLTDSAGPAALLHSARAAPSRDHGLEDNLRDGLVPAAYLIWSDRAFPSHENLLLSAAAAMLIYLVCVFAVTVQVGMAAFALMFALDARDFMRELLGLDEWCGA